MSPTTQIKAWLKDSAHDLTAAEKRLAKADAAARAAVVNLNDAKAAVGTAKAKHANNEQMLKLANDAPTTTKTKPAPKAVKAASVATPKKKPGPKPKAAKAAKPEVNQSRAARGRRAVARGDRPPVKTVIAKVLGRRVMNAQEVYEAIKAKGQLPDSGDPRGYIGYLLSASKVTITRAGKEVEVPLFERVHEKGRGFYKNQGVTVSKAGPKPKAKAAPKPAKAAAKPAKKVAAAPAPDGKRTVKCGKCGKTGHNAKGHDKWAAGKAAPKAAKPAKAAKAAPFKKPSSCSICGDSGHNKRGHAKATSAKPAKTNGTNGHTTPAKVAAKPSTEKKSVKCGKCGETGHNAKGHDKWAAGTKADGTKNGTTAPAAKSEPKAETKAAEVEPSTDALLKEAGLDLANPTSAA